MQYQRSLSIEQRLEAVLRLIRTGQYSTPRLADEIGVSTPTISRCVEALRNRGHDIVAENRNGSWRYVLKRKAGGAKTRRIASAESAEVDSREVLRVEATTIQAGTP